MRWLDWFPVRTRENETEPPISYLPGMRYDLYPGDPDRLPPEITLTRCDGSTVVYVPKVDDVPLPKVQWRAFNETWLVTDG